MSVPTTWSRYEATSLTGWSRTYDRPRGYRIAHQSGVLEMPTLTLHFAPDTCARVPLIALEEIGCPYKIEIVAFAKGQHRSPEYLALNPKGKVPTLIADGRALSANVAILSWLARTFPHAGVLPAGTPRLSHRVTCADLA